MKIVNTKCDIERARSYLRGLIGTRTNIIHWEGDVRSKPKCHIPTLVKEISRVKAIIKDMEKTHDN